MKGGRVFITGMGTVSSLGSGTAGLEESLKKNRTGIGPLRLFSPSVGNVFPVGEIPGLVSTTDIPRTHQIALATAMEALAGRDVIPDAIILGTTTGGMTRTEELLRIHEPDPERYRHHSTGSVADYMAGSLKCTGPIMTITTACSSGAAAITLACRLLRSGAARAVLAGGADALCRLTYYGFNALQLIDPTGARPLDRFRRGMTVAEGAAFLLLEAGDATPAGAIAELLGCGLSCDAYHPAAPHPEGAGARAAMLAAIASAGITNGDIDYINLHGTGTKDNDLAESKALRSLFGNELPPLSSVKGATGHTLAASGAIEAVISALCIRAGIIPANTGCVEPDPELGVTPELFPLEKKVSTVLSNSFGFGGNNACLVLSDPVARNGNPADPQPLQFEILGSFCYTGAGGMEKTMDALSKGGACAGVLPLAELSGKLPAREVRRLKRLPRLALSLAMEAHAAAGIDTAPSSVFFGTAWGPLSETNDFLEKLYESNEEFTSPTDFVGSVHNAPAGQIAIFMKATGANITVTGGDYSFEQALMAAGICGGGSGEIVMVLGSDEHHDRLTPLFDLSSRAASSPADGGGALCLRRCEKPAGPRIASRFFENAADNPAVMKSLIAALGGAESIGARFGVVFAGMPASDRDRCGIQLDEFISAAGPGLPVVDYRNYFGEFASSGAVAAACASAIVAAGSVPAALAGGTEVRLAGRGILLLGLGSFITAVEILN